MRPILCNLVVSDRRLSEAMGRLVKIEIWCLKYLNAVTNARSLSISLPSTAAASSTPQCVEIGRPGQSGHVSPAAASQTVMTKSRFGALGAVKTCQRFDNSLSVG